MRRTIALRMVEAMGTCVLLSIFVFALGSIVPGDLALVIAGTDGASPERIDALRRELRLDDPVATRYGAWLSGAVVGDFGVSPITGRVVRDEVMRTFPVTFRLATYGLGIATLLGIPIGVFAAVRADRFADRAARMLSLAVFSVPSFVLGILFVFLGSRYFPAMYTSIYVPPSGGLVQHLRSLLLPALSVGLPLAAMIAQMTRGAMLESLSQDYVRLARALGMRAARVHYLHALKPSLAPVVTLIGLLFGSLLGGLIVIEVIFNLPGIGRTIYAGIQQRDFSLVMAGTLLVGLAYILVNLIVDLLYPVFDPRQRR